MSRESANSDDASHPKASIFSRQTAFVSCVCLVLFVWWAGCSGRARVTEPTSEASQETVISAQEKPSSIEVSPHLPDDGSVGRESQPGDAGSPEPSIERQAPPEQPSPQPEHAPESVFPCGDGLCQIGEEKLCPQDCPATCGNGVCTPEEQGKCLRDCPATCGNGVCDAQESTICPQDCPVNKCGNGTCDPGEATTCPQDCPVDKCGNGVCDANERTTCPKDCCTALTAETYENNEGNNAEFTAKFFPTKDRNNEYIDMFFRSSALGTHTYGTGDNADLYTCKQCMLVVRNKKNFYPIQGTITINTGSQPTKKTLFATLSQLTLIEIKISASYHSIPVSGGECITLAPAKINVK